VTFFIPFGLRPFFILLEIEEIFAVKKGSIQWKDAKDVLVKQKQHGELP
jgi:hypothetical protein